MGSDNGLVAIEFSIPEEKYPVESLNIESVPRVGELVSVSARFNEDGERVDPNSVPPLEYYDLDYACVLRGVVESVERDYHTSPDRTECTVNVELSNVEWNGGKGLSDA